MVVEVFGLGMMHVGVFGLGYGESCVVCLVKVVHVCELCWLWTCLGLGDQGVAEKGVCVFCA